MARKRAAKRTSSGNGLTTYSMHARDDRTAPILASLRRESAAHPAFAMAGPLGPVTLDPETAAKGYLKQAFQSESVPALTAPAANGSESEFKSLGVETIPLTGTKTVKFRQQFNGIPVYGSLVTVELDEGNALVSLNSALGSPQGVDAIAKISPAAAVKAAQKYHGSKKELGDVVPRLQYYFDRAASKWRLVFVLEDVPVRSSPPVRGSKRRDNVMAARMFDYVVDAHTGTIVAELPRTPSFAAIAETAVDGLGNTRQIEVDVNGTKKTLVDRTLNVETFDFRFSDPIVDEQKLPGGAIRNPPAWPASAVSAHANAADVATFLRNVLRRNNIDNTGGTMKSSINCVVAEESRDGRQWFNAFWNGAQMVYGQRSNGTALLSLSVDLDVVGHEMFHGVTEHTARLEYVAQPGALNESYSDIFGIIIANFHNADPRNWNWNVGEGLSPDGKPFRDMSNPPRFGQPDHMKDFQVLPNTQAGDWGGVHTNSGIHNKAAFLILTAVHAAALVFTPTESAAVFYLALTQQLSRTSQFADSRRGVLASARTFFRAETPAQIKVRLDAIEKAFTSVGIS